MAAQIIAEWIESNNADWQVRLQSLLQQIPPHTPTTTFPVHFLESTLPRIGGKVIAYKLTSGAAFGVGFLFPRTRDEQGRAIYSLRFCPFANSSEPDSTALQEVTQRLLTPDQAIFYLPQAEHKYVATQHNFGSVEIGHPSQAEARQIPLLQQQVWGAAANECYPYDIHSVEFGADTSLVARVDGQLAGFLLGFTKFAGYPLPEAWQQRFQSAIRLESQIMGVLPQYRGLRISALLKQQQALEASQRGIDLINWTADPLQYVNAALNFGLLQAIAFDFLPNLYSFRNELNRVPASRLGLSWLVNTQRVRERLTLDARSEVRHLAEHPEIPRLNQGWQNARFDVSEPIVAFEIPENWNALQRENLEEALRWRETTDQLFAKYIGKQDGQYVITGVGTDQERRFLIAEQVNGALWERLSVK